MNDKVQIGIASALLGVLVVGGALIPPAPNMVVTPNGSTNSSTTNSTTQKINFNKDELITLANQISTDLTLRKYDDVTPHFSESVLEQMPKEILETNWLYMAGSIGKFQEIAETEYLEYDAVAVITDTINFDSRAVLVSYSFDENNEIVGIWFANALLKPIALSTDVFTEEIIQVGHNENKMNGLLTLPVGVENPPVVILVHGSGTHDLNESIGVNKPFYDLAHGLAEHGIASIRYDKRHAVYPDELPALINANNFTLEDEVTKDVDAIINQIQGMDNVDNDNIYILGHSLGGMLAPKIATENSEVAGIISMAGTLRSIEDIILTQNEEVISNMTSLSADEQSELLATVQEQIDFIKSLTADSKETIMGYPASYWYSFQTLDNENIARNLDIPILVLQGTDDFQISIDIDYPLWEQTISGNDQAIFKTYEGLNHLMMESSGLRNIGDYEIEGTVSSEVIADIAEFILN